MSDKSQGSGSIDPELAALLGDIASEDTIPDFSDLFNEHSPSNTSTPQSKQIQPEDYLKQSFKSIGIWERMPDPVFMNKDYYSNVLRGEGSISQLFHKYLQNFLETEDSQKKGLFRQRLIQSWWELVRNLALHYDGNSVEKRWALRFAYLLPNLISMDQRKMLSKVIPDNSSEEPVHYVDEWLDLLKQGRVNPLATDEKIQGKANPETKAKFELNRAQSDKEANYSYLRNLIAQRESIDADLTHAIQSITRHDVHSTNPNMGSAYSLNQRNDLKRSMEMLKQLGKLNREISINIDKFNSASNQLEKINEKIEIIGTESTVDESVLVKEINSISQIVKICVGRQGNHFPFLMKNYFSSRIDMIATRENVIHNLDQIEKIDSGVFHRVFRHKIYRIVPHVIIVPCFGEKGFCWEPFELFNRGTSRGRIAVPMFPKNLKTAIIYALGDLRWNIAKEKAAHYWMEEGLTGQYYQWFIMKKSRGDVRVSFLEDYILWISSEYEGVQKLDKDVRGIFWRYIPFSQMDRERLRNRGFVYNELYKKDLNREASDGY